MPEGHRSVCQRCGAELSKYKAESLSRTFALSLAALILYVPANLYPILTMEFFGASQADTIWTGVVALAKAGMWPIAILVFLASIAIPLIKILGLLFLVATIRWDLWLKRRTQMFRFIDVIGRWSMLDVFLLSILVAVVKLGQLATVEPGLGSLAFAAVVVLTIFAANSFDPKLIWKNGADETQRKLAACEKEELA
ncbi:MAG: paraquat-inducible protein A [Pseudomonadota bacterium]